MSMIMGFIVEEPSSRGKGWELGVWVVVGGGGRGGSGGRQLKEEEDTGWGKGLKRTSNGRMGEGGKIYYRGFSRS